MADAGEMKPESFDIMQYFYGSVHDPLIHCKIYFSDHIDEGIFKRAVILSVKAVPQICCCFDSASERPRWRKQNFTAEDIVRMIEAEPQDEPFCERLLASTIDIEREPQLKIFLIRGQTSDSLCVIINHMVCDGAGFKEYLYLISDLYTKLKNGEKEISDLKPYSRGTAQLFAGFGILEKLNILFASYDLSQQRRQPAVSLEGDSGNPFFVTRRISERDFSAIKVWARSRGATVNDLFLAVYARLLSQKTGAERIVLPCPTDLRHFMSPGRKYGICNLTSNFICDITVKSGDSFDGTVAQVSGQIRRQKTDRSCLKSIVMLELAFHVIPFRIMRKVFGKIFTIPVISYTNLGIINKEALKFGDVEILEAYLTGAVKYVPYFQIALSTYNDTCTLSCNLHGTPRDKRWIEDFLEQLIKELLLSSRNTLREE